MLQLCDLSVGHIGNNWLIMGFTKKSFRNCRGGNSVIYTFVAIGRHTSLIHLLFLYNLPKTS